MTKPRAELEVTGSKLSAIEKRQMFKDAYEVRRPSQPPKTICKKLNINPGEFKEWMSDGQFVADLLAIDRRRLFDVHEYFSRNLPAIAENAVEIATGDLGAKAVSAMRLIFEFVDALQSKTMTVNVNSITMNSSDGEISDEELIRRRERLKRLVESHKRVSVSEG